MAASLPKKIDGGQNLETYCLIWLDATVNTVPENVQAQIKFQKIISCLRTFDDDQQCFHFIKNLPENDRIILIVSGRFGRIIVPKIDNMKQITSVYVYCFDKKANEQWAQKYTKVKSVLVQLDELFQQIGKDYKQQQYEKIHEPFPINVLHDELESMDEYEKLIDFQLLVDCLIRMRSISNEKEQLIKFCKEYYKKYYTELAVVNEFENTYSSDKALWWYTRPSFLSRLLNRAFRDQNVDLLLLFQFFIHDVISQLGKNIPSSPIRTYRSQLISKEELQILQCSVGKFLSINSFLSTNFDEKKTRSFLLSHNASTDAVKTLFKIETDNQLQNIRPFNNIEPHGYFHHENEILFSVGSIFRIMKVEYRDDQICYVRLSLCPMNEPGIQHLFQSLKRELGIEKTSLVHYGNILCHMGKSDNAERYYRRYLNYLPDDHPDAVGCYRGLGKIAELKKNFPSSLNWYERALDLYSIISDSNQSDVAETYYNIGSVYSKMNNHTDAIESYRKALEILENLGDNGLFFVSKCRNRIGLIYQVQGKYSKALENFHESSKILNKNYPKRHMDIAGVMKHIARTQELDGQYQQALKTYENALKIYSRLLPTTQVYVNEIEKAMRRIPSK